MAYKYTLDDVKKKLSDSGLTFSDADMKLAETNPDAGMSIANYMLDYRNATTDDQRAWAHSKAENTRSTYGNYSGGEDGSKFYLDTPTPASYNNESFENPYADQQQSALDAILNRQGFSYDPTTDTAYQAARKQYIREGKRATEDTLGQYAAMTGGMPSTAAVNAAAQAGQYYNTQLSDQLANYRDSAYQRYIDDVGLNYDNLSALTSLIEAERNQYDTDRNFEYNQLTDDLAYRTDREATDYERQQYATEYGDALSLDLYAQLMEKADAGDAESLKRANAILNALLAKNNPAV